MREVEVRGYLLDGYEMPLGIINLFPVTCTANDNYSTIDQLILWGRLWS